MCVRGPPRDMHEPFEREREREEGREDVMYTERIRTESARAHAQVQYACVLYLDDHQKVVELTRQRRRRPRWRRRRHGDECCLHMARVNDAVCKPTEARTPHSLARAQVHMPAHTVRICMRNMMRIAHMMHGEAGTHTWCNENLVLV